jgi:hypothetical protein
VTVLSALWAVARFVFGPDAAWWITAPVLGAVVGLWLIVPVSLRRHRTTPGDARS